MLPLGEALNVVRRRSDGELVIRSDAGHDFCRFDGNWKMHALVFIRDSDELLREVYPRMAHCDPEWMELREFYCPRSGRLLEVEAVTRGLPGGPRLPPRHRGLLRGLARAGACPELMERAAAEAATAAAREPGADRARERDRARLRGARRPVRAADGADHGPGGADDLLAGGALRAARRAGLPGDPVRQPRHRPLDDDRLGGRAGERGDGAGLRPAGIQAERHGGRHGRPAGSPGDRSRARGRRLDGRDDRPAGGDRPSAADALALLDHVGHGQPALPDAALARVRDPDGEAPEDAGGVHGRGGEDARPDRLARLPDGRAPLSRPSSAAPTTAASAPAASPASCTRSTAPATGRPPCDGSTCRRWSSTAPGTRWCARAPGGRWPTRSPARG